VGAVAFVIAAILLGVQEIRALPGLSCGGDGARVRFFPSKKAAALGAANKQSHGVPDPGRGINRGVSVT